MKKLLSILLVSGMVTLISCDQSKEKYVQDAIKSLKTKDCEAAMLYCQIAIDKDPNYSLAYCYRGAAEFCKGDLTFAISDCNKAIKLDSNNADAYLIRGTVKYTQGDKDGACLDLNKAGELGNSAAYDLIRTSCN